MNVIYGAGYNPKYLDVDREAELSLPPFISFIELGIREYELWLQYNSSKNIDLSLHLARTPVTEDKRIQERYIQYLQKILENQPVKSVGIHLTGPRSEGIGRFGFSSHYVPLPKFEDAAMLFASRMQEKLNCPFWIENANFYSANIEDIFSTWESVRRICKETNARIIVDLSHIFIDAANVGLDPKISLGAVPWEFVSEIHLSGIVHANDGSFHDGHSLPVYPKIWSLCQSVLDILNKKNESIVITIEHTDPLWSKHKVMHDEDFFHLENLTKTNKSYQSKSVNAENYAMNYLCKLLQQRIPQLSEYCAQKKISIISLVEEWAHEINYIEEKRIVFTIEETCPSERSEVGHFTTEFLRFLKKRTR